MGSQLLVASQHGVILTDRGKELADLLISLDEKLFSISQSLGSESKEAAGVVQFSSTEAMAGLFIVPMLREFTAEHSSITLHIRNITNMLDFRENQSDIVLGFAPSEQDGIKSRPAGVMHLVPYASNEYVKQYGLPSRTNLENHKFVDAEYYSSKTDIWKPWQAALKRGKVAHLCDNSFAYCLAVKEGLGIGLLGNYVLPDQELVPADIDVHVALRMYLLADSERLKSRPVRIVYNWLSTILGEDNQWLAARPKITERREQAFWPNFVAGSPGDIRPSVNPGPANQNRTCGRQGTRRHVRAALLQRTASPLPVSGLARMLLLRQRQDSVSGSRNPQTPTNGHTAQSGAGRAPELKKRN